MLGNQGSEDPTGRLSLGKTVKQVEAGVGASRGSEKVSVASKLGDLVAKHTVLVSPASPYEFPRAVITKYCKLSSLNHQKYIPSQFWRPEVWGPGAQVSAGPIPSEGSEKESTPCLSPSFWGRLAIPGAPWLVNASLGSLSSHGILLVWTFLYLISLFLYGHQLLHGGPS